MTPNGTVKEKNILKEIFSEWNNRTEAETNRKISIRIRFDSIHSTFDSIRFDLLFKIPNSIRFDSTDPILGSIRFDSIRLIHNRNLVSCQRI